MAEQQDYAGLGWVKDEITQTLNTAQGALEEHLVEPGNPAHLNVCQEAFNQVHSTLDMLHQTGASCLSLEIKLLTEALVQQRVQQPGIALECLMQASLQLPGYIEHTIRNQSDSPLSLLPLINHMRSLRGGDFLPEAVFFFPILDHDINPVGPGQLDKLERSGLDRLLRKLRQKYQVSLAGYLREQERPRQLQLMGKLFAKLQDLLWGSPISPLWEACVALTEGLGNRSIEQTLHVANLLRELDHQLRAFIEQGVSFINQPPQEELFRGLLYCIATAEGRSGFTGTLKDRYQLEETLAQATRSTTKSFAGVDAVTPVVQALNNELAGVKETLDLYLLSQDADPLVLENQLPIIQQVADTLAMLGLHDQRQAIVQQKEHLATVIHSGNDPGPVLMDAAAAFLQLEQALKHYQKNYAQEHEQEQGVPTQTSLLDEVYLAVVQEARGSLNQAKEIISDNVDTPQAWANQEQVPALLRDVHAGLSMTPLANTAVLVDRCRQHILSHWAGAQADPGATSLEHLGDALASIEYYLERLEDNPQGEISAILEVAEESLKALESIPDETGQANEEPIIRLEELELVDLEPIPAQDSQPATVTTPPGNIEAPPAGDVTGDILDDELVQVFTEEAQEVHQQLLEKIPAWQAQAQDGADAEEDGNLVVGIRRIFHTLKGSGRMVGANVVGELAWSVENMLNRLIDDSIKTGPVLFDVINRATAMLPELIQDFSQQSQLLTSDVLLCMEQADALARGELVPITEEEADLAGDFFDAVELEHTLEESVQPEPSPEKTEADPGEAATVYDPQQATLFLTDGLELLLDADQYINQWQQALPSQELALFRAELITLSSRSKQSQLTSLAELCDILLDVCDYVGQHHSELPAALAAPLTKGFETLVDMMNQVAAQQTPVSPQAVFTALRESLETLLLEDLRDTTSEPFEPRPEEPTPINPAPLNVEVEEHDQGLLELFLEEAADLTKDCAQSLEQWLKDRANAQALPELQRSLHTLKGGAKMADQEELANLSHAMEEVYQSISRDDHLATTAPLGLLQAAHNQIETMLQAIRLDDPMPDPSPLIAKLQNWPTNDRSVPAPLPDYLGAVEKPLANVTSDQDESRSDHALLESTETKEASLVSPVSQVLPKSSEMMRVSADLLEQLIDLSGESSILRTRVEQQTLQVSQTLEEMESTINRVKEQLRRLDIETQKQILSRHETGPGASPDFDPLEMDRYSELSQLSYSLVESATDLVDLKDTILEQNRGSETLLIQQARTQVDLQEKLIRARVVSFSRLVPRLRRMVRQLSSELGKPVELNVVNAEGEMDRTMLERIMGPLEHLVRNAIDHGIENTPSQREEQDKPGAGQLELCISRDGSDILLELADDGQGIDTEAVYAKALEKHMIAPGDQLQPKDIAQFILEPGLTTAQSVTQVSGRGLGLDVVNTEVKQLGGSVEIDSEVGLGTRFKLRLPSTLATNRALMVEVSSVLYAIPMPTVDGVTVVHPNTVMDCYQNKKTLEYGGIEHRVMFMGELLDGVPPKIQGQQSPLLIVQRDGQNIALHVDEILGSRDIITKSLGPQFSGLSGINGASMLGDGRVVIIIDPVALLRKYRTSGNRQSLALPKNSASAPTLRVLVIDDSVAVRKVTSRLLAREGYQVDSARDGVEAMAKLSEHVPDIVLLDIEMPRMDGYEVASAMRNDPALKAVPIIMITSRTGEKHRTRAFGLGVNDYIDKPYQESELLETIAKLVSFGRLPGAEAG